MRDFLDDRPLKLRRTRSGRPASLRAFLIALVLILLCVVLVMLDRQGLISPARGALQQLVAPAATWLTGRRDAALDALAGPRSADDLAARVAALEAERGQLEAELLRYRQAALENESLRQQLAIERTTPWTVLGAEVTMRAPDAARRVMTIARGSDDGVRVGMAVVGQQAGGPTALVGIVEAVGPRTADVLLITDFGSLVSARVLRSATAPLGLVRGQWQRGSRLQLEPLGRDSQLAVGDSVVTAGLTDALGLPLDLAAVPANVPIGMIETIQSEGQRQLAELRPYADPDQVRYVWVILSQGD